jgi:hypothetical protein
MWICVMKHVVKTLVYLILESFVNIVDSKNSFRNIVYVKYTRNNG